MTLYHFGNCLALVYAPYHMVYKYSGIAEYGSFNKCLNAAGLYMFTQLCKMLLLATFFPDTDSAADGEPNVFLEILKATVDFADLFGLYLAINNVQGKGHAKILTAALGWASAEVLLTRAVPLWSGARGAEFDWRHVRQSAAATVSLAHTAAAAALVWLHSRSDLPQRYTPIVLTLLAVTPYRSLLEDSVAKVLLLNPWSALGLKAVHAVATGLTALGMYAVLAQSSM